MESANDIIAGTASGVLCAVLEHPFDTLKTRMQAHGGTYMADILRLLRAEGPLGFYRGVSPRLGASGLEYALTFGGYKTAMRAVGADEREPEVWQILVGGAGGGIATAAVLTPLELVKCSMQVNPRAARASSLACTRALFQQGGVAALYRGGGAMLVREVYGTTMWCGTNDLLRMKLSPSGASDDHLDIASVVVAGGCSGLVCSALVYPIDVIKTHVQVSHRFRGGSIVQVARCILRESGWWKGLYRGFGVVALCSFPSSAAVFLSFEGFRLLLASKESQLLTARRDTCESRVQSAEIHLHTISG